MNYLEIFSNAYTGYANYLWREITFQVTPFWKNYFWMLVFISGAFFLLEILRPWRKDQARFRKDFWLDFFYMFFNFFLFSLLIYNASSTLIVDLFNDLILYVTGFDLQASNPMRNWPLWAILLTGFIVRDFIQWWVHRLLHKSPTLWEFHKVHHSVEQMGFAAHLRYHWMENVVYRTLEYIPLALLGVGLHDFFLIHIFTLAWGHYNHANLRVSGRVTAAIVASLAATFLLTTDYILPLPYSIAIIAVAGLLGGVLLGPYMKYLFNSPEMHIWHHSYHLPEGRRSGVNFGLTLAIWDYIWKTNFIPHDGRDIPLGFPGLKDFPKTFAQQNIHGFGANKKSSQ